MSNALTPALPLLLALLPALTPALTLAGEGAPAPIRFEIQELLDKPVIGPDHPDVHDNKYGFEGGTVVKVGPTYHMFASEKAGDPDSVRMRLAHWQSPDARAWKRLATIKETSGKTRAETGLSYESVWSPMVVFNPQENQWELFHVYYDEGGACGGRINRMISTVKGREGIAGPFKDVGIVLQPDAGSQPWENGLQPTDSFYPYPVGDRWLAFYGGSDAKSWWRVGLAEAPALAGPWRRCPTGNPVPIEPIFAENPIVTRIDGQYVAIYDCTTAGAPTYEQDAHDIGYSCSPDGIHWQPGIHLTIQPKGPANWSRDIRTPLCLIDEGKGVFTMIYTGLDKDRQFWPVGMVRLKRVK